MLHRVGGQMNLQRGGICVRTVAIVALEGLVFVVLPSVGLQRWKDGKEKACNEIRLKDIVSTFM